GLLAVVALPEAPVEQDRRRTGREGDPGGLRRPAEVGAEHHGDAVVTAPGAQFGRVQAPAGGQPAGRPAGGHAAPVVLAERGGLEDDRDGHPLMRATTAPADVDPATSTSGPAPLAARRNVGSPPTRSVPSARPRM